MTLPFRRRHHDDDRGHDRARLLISAELVEPLAEDEAAWLAAHLDACDGCRRDREAYLVDSALLRSLREQPPEPPRDLWARTSAALDREAARRRPAGGAASAGARWIRLGPLGAAAGALVVLVLVGTTFFRPVVPPGALPSGSLTAVNSPVVGPTPITIHSQPIRYLRARADGSFEIVTAMVEAVCPTSEPKCAPPVDEDATQQVPLGSKAASFTISPRADQLVVEPANEAGSLGRILVIPVPNASPEATAGPPASPTTIPATAPPTEVPSSGSPSSGPSAAPTPEPTPEGQIEIASGVTMVGEAAYSANGSWLAFAARPVDGSTGPDLYLWAVSSPAAIQVTSDHQTYFSAWLGDRVLASTVAVEAPEPGASGEPTGEPNGEPTTAAEDTPAPDGSSSPDGSGAPAPEPIIGRPSSFMLDPATLARVDFPAGDVWLPVVDPTARKVAYWSGTLVGTDGLSWRLGEGELVLDGWSEGTAVPGASESAAAPGVETPAGETPAGGTPAASAGLPLGPVGSRVELVDGPIAAFRARFDPEGNRLGVWVAEDPTATVGRLHLLVIDPATGTVDVEHSPLRGEPALRAFSIDAGRLAWVSPNGQDGEQSAVKVLGWQGAVFGEIQTRSGTDLYIVR
jgi:hypothetical protein